MKIRMLIGKIVYPIVKHLPASYSVGGYCESFKKLYRKNDYGKVRS